MRKLTEQDIASVIGAVNAGYTILRARVKGGAFSDSDHYGIVLGRNAKGYYVTWEFHLEDERPEYYWGRYLTNDPEAALRDYETRGISQDD